MARLRTTSALLLLALSRVSAQSYQLIQEYNASNIFEEFNFFNVRFALNDNSDN